MAGDIKNISNSELIAKIQNLEAERKRTAETLKRYKEELAIRTPIYATGVSDVENIKIGDCFYTVNQSLNISKITRFHNDAIDYLYIKARNIFSTEESAKKHSEMMLTWRNALSDNFQLNKIDIEALLPLLPRGFVAMDRDQRWGWFEYVPMCFAPELAWHAMTGRKVWISGFNIKPVDNWLESLRRCGL